MANHRLRQHAKTIWKSSVAAVDSQRLVNNVVEQEDDLLVICGHEISLSDTKRIVVVGAGKAGAGMAAAFEQAVGDKVLDEKVSGWINVPADCVRPLKRIHLHAARPAGVNEPTAEGVEGTLKILELVSDLTAADVCVVLISGGGSALLPAPVAEISLDDKQQVTRLLMRSKATIDELNCVRKQLSRVKGGGLVRATQAGLVVTLIISDVIDDPLEIIASGPTVADSSTPAEALAILKSHVPAPDDIPGSVLKYLSAAASRSTSSQAIPETVHNHVIGNNALALAAAAEKAGELGYTVHSLGSANRGEAVAIGRELAWLNRAVRDRDKPLRIPLCILSGGEPVVELATTDRPRRGGRNQEVVLAAMEALWDDDWEQLVFLSGGTDGEDGPTDAAGAFADAEVHANAKALELVPHDFLSINNSYEFFDKTGGLLKTGPTHTNVMDVRVALIDETTGP